MHGMEGVDNCCGYSRCVQLLATDVEVVHSGPISLTQHEGCCLELRTGLVGCLTSAGNRIFTLDKTMGGTNVRISLEANSRYIVHAL